MNKKKFSRYLKDFDFEILFNELGWDNFDNALSVRADDELFNLQGIAQKRGFAIFQCVSQATSEIPPVNSRKKIENQCEKLYHEHLIIYTDTEKSCQVWQLAVRESGKPKQVREVRYYTHQDSEILFQRLRGLLFTLDEEESITLVDVKARVMDNMAKNTEKITKKFYTDFKKQHGEFLKFIKGINDTLADKDNKDKQWYASLMLNRLMFCYFIQKKGYLNQDLNYLQNKLKQTREQAGQDLFYNFYKEFLLQLFHQGLGRPESRRQISVDLGKIPYLNGGLFDVHELEIHFADIKIKDQAFENIFAFFDQWNWHLDTGKQATGKDINPDVIGYIFEKYINDRAAMGAYYTKEDITEYISKNCIIPFIFDEIKRRYPEPFKPEGEIWQIMKNSRDAYIYDAVKKGMENDLPENIAIGLDTSKPGLLERRKDWNFPAPEEYALPTEIWRETVARRQRYEQVLGKIEAGAINRINDLITFNLNIRQFTQDIIENTNDPRLIREFYKTIAGYEKNNENRPPLSVLDPTCGSGAFLFAALNVLEPIYEGCIGRMEQFANEEPGKHKFFESVLSEAGEHSQNGINEAGHLSLKYFIYKSIILNNLYGVDIMKEAVEIAKLRLFLKLVATVDMNPGKPNFGLEPLPDIDFNIRSGNTLVGFATEQELMNAIKDREGLFAGEKLEAFKEECRIVSLAFTRFKDAQLVEDAGTQGFSKAKKELSGKLKALNEKLNSYLASVYDIDSEKQKKKYEKWSKSHQPFHWFAEFYTIINDRGGFDVVIGNPPYVEYNSNSFSYKIINYKTLSCRDLYAFVMERVYQISILSGRIGLIVPISVFGVDRFSPIQSLSQNILGRLWISCYSNRPSQLFEGAQKRLTIILGNKKEINSEKLTLYSTRYFRWKKDEFPNLFKSRVQYCKRQKWNIIFENSVEKIGSNFENKILQKLEDIKGSIASNISLRSGEYLYYTRKFGYFLSFLDFIPKMTEIKTGKSREPSELKSFIFNNKSELICSISALTSSTFYWFWHIVSDCRNLNKRDILEFPFNLKKINNNILKELYKFGIEYIKTLKLTSKAMTKSGCKIETFNYLESKPIIDEIDKVLAKHYGFTEEELDFIINYDIKYRMGIKS